MYRIYLSLIMLITISVNAYSSDEYSSQDYGSKAISNGVGITIISETIDSTPDEDTDSKNACKSILPGWDNYKKINPVITDRLHELVGDYGTSREYLVNKLGKYKVASEDIHIHHDRDPTIPAYKINEAVWNFDGAVLNLNYAYPITSETKNPYIIDKISITKKSVPLKLPINIGSSIDEVQCYFNQFYSRDRANKLLEYDTQGIDGDRINVKIYFDSSLKVNQMDFEYYID